MLDVPRIQKILKKARCWDMYDSPFGGAYLHGHLFRPVIPLAELALWEELMEVTLPAEKKTQLLRERDTIVQFQDAMERRDQKELRFLISSIRVQELSAKSRFFYMYHRHALRRELPEDAVVTAFCSGLELGEGRRWNYQRYKGFYDPERKRVMDGARDTRCPYAVPIFQQFFQTFLDIGEKR